MRGVDRITTRFEKSETQARNTASEQLKTIIANTAAFNHVRDGRKLFSDAMDFEGRMKRGEAFTPAQYSYIDGIYEKMWEGLGMDSVNRHHDKPRFSMRHPK